MDDDALCEENERALDGEPPEARESARLAMPLPPLPLPPPLLKLAHGDAGRSGEHESGDVRRDDDVALCQLYRALGDDLAVAEALLLRGVKNTSSVLLSACPSSSLTSRCSR